MDFKLFSSDFYTTTPIEYLDATAEEAFSVGEACSLASGLLTKCGATTAPEYITVGEVAADSGKVPCIRVHSSQIFETTFSAAASSIVVGNKVTINTDGLQVTATSTSGVAEVVKKMGDKSGDPVLVRF